MEGLNFKIFPHQIDYRQSMTKKKRLLIWVNSALSLNFRMIHQFLANLYISKVSEG